MKPSKIIFYDDNSSSPPPPSSFTPASKMANYWNMIKWRECLRDETLHYINIRLLLKIIAACISIGMIGFIVSSLIFNNNNHKRDNGDINNEDLRLLVKTINESSTNRIIDTSVPSTIAKEDISIDIKNDRISNSSTLPRFTNNNIQNEPHEMKSNDEISLTKNYVSCFFNFPLLHIMQHQHPILQMLIF